MTHTNSSILSFDTVLSTILILSIYTSSNRKPFSLNFCHSTVAIFSSRCNTLSYYKWFQNLQRYLGTTHPSPMPSSHNTCGHHRRVILLSTSSAYVALKQAHKHKILFFSVLLQDFNCNCQLLIWQKIQLTGSHTKRGEGNFCTVKAHTSHWPRRYHFSSKRILLESIGERA